MTKTLEQPSPDSSAQGEFGLEETELAEGMSCWN